jgi:glutaredoxin-dependent peroxiredoxin
MALSIGTTAPSFSLKTKILKGDLKDVALADSLGQKNIVLLFFPLAFTSVCTQEMCDITSGLNTYKNLNAEVFAISVDSPFAQEAWAIKENIGITLLSDLNKKVAEAYGTLLPDLIGLGAVSARAAFVIGKDGKIAYSEQTPTPKDLPDFAAIKSTLEKLP